MSDHRTWNQRARTIGVDNAKTILNSRVWERWDKRELFEQQLLTRELFVPFEVFKSCGELVLNRTMSDYEFHFPDRIMAEFYGYEDTKPDVKFFKIKLDENVKSEDMSLEDIKHSIMENMPQLLSMMGINPEEVKDIKFDSIKFNENPEDENGHIDEDE